MGARVFAAFALSLALCCADKCPEEAEDRTENWDSKQVRVKFESQAEEDVELKWVNPDGLEIPIGLLTHGDVNSQDSFPGHLFHFRLAKNHTLLLKYRVPLQAPPHNILVQRCDGLLAIPWLEASKARWAEFEHLVSDVGAPCVGPSSNWSCIRHVLPEELALRDRADYGFHDDDVPGNTPYKEGQTADTLFTWQQSKIINVTAYEGGFLKMEMTEAMKEVLYPWYQMRMEDSLRPHGIIPGGFTNIQKVSFDKIELNQHPAVKEKVIQELKAVLEWWTKMKLRHTMTFGVRVYRRNAMLLNHLDRHATHIASAVIQVGQKVDSDGGWPLEVIHPHRPGVTEIYLQPGQMVLYEGARIVHGRPMRFRGDEFSNIFTHFAPLDWKGADLSRPNNPHFKQEL